ncbi:MAG: hypothetical protein IKP98_02315 [Bacilli bacterium]|nr:hypothetical protein [Bacilli bacterium]
MELENLVEILEAKKKDYEKQNNLKKFYKETLTVEEYANFEKLLKTKKSEISELETVVKKMQTYSDQYDYERIMAMSEAEFDYIKDSIIESKKDEIRKHNKDIDEQNRSINSEINALLEENVSLKRELEEITNEIGNTGKYTKDNVNRAKTIKEKIQKNNEEIEKCKNAILDNDKKVIVGGEITLDFESYKQEKLGELSPKKYLKEIPEVSVMDEFLCKLQKQGKTPEEIENSLNEFKKSYIGGYEKEGYEYFDPIYRADFDCLDEFDKDAEDATELLEKYFEVTEKGKNIFLGKGIIERNMKVAYNTNRKHNISEVTKVELLQELIDGAPFYGSLDENSIITSGCFLNLKDRIITQKERINRVIAWKNADKGNTTLAKVATHIGNYNELSKTRDLEEENISEIEKIFAKLRKYFEEECFDESNEAIEFTTLYDELATSCGELKELSEERERLEGKKVVINKKGQAKDLEEVLNEIEDKKDYIKEIHKRMKADISAVFAYVTELLSEPEKIMYPEVTEEESIENIFSMIHRKDDSVEFSLQDEEDYLYELESDFKNAIMLLEKYEDNKTNNKKRSIVKLCSDLGINSISQGIIDALVEEKDKKELFKASDITKRINEARVNLYLREQKEKALNEASKAKSEILGAVINHLDLDATKTDIFAAI